MRFCFVRFPTQNRSGWLQSCAITAQEPGSTRTMDRMVKPGNWSATTCQVQAAVCSNMATGVNLQTQTTAHYVHQQRVSAGYFEVLGIHPIIGRTFSAEEDRPHGPKA